VYQPKLPLQDSGILHECANPECFYAGSLLTTEDVVWKHFWNSAIEDLDVRATCPSCAQPMMHWDAEGESENGTIRTLL